MTIETPPPQEERRLPLGLLGVIAVALAIVAAVVARIRASHQTLVSMSITIERPPSEVFAFVSDARNVLEWMPAAVDRVKVTEGPVGLGTRFEATDRIAGRIFSHSQEIIGYEKDRSVTTRMSEPWNAEYEIRVEPADDGTLLSVQTSGRGSGIAAFFDVLPNSMLARQFERDYGRLKGLLEGDESLRVIRDEEDEDEALEEVAAIRVEPDTEPADRPREESPVS